MGVSSGNTRTFPSLMVVMSWLQVVLSTLLAVHLSVGEPDGTPAVPWWSNAVYYRILVDSFKDGDGDGLGDLAGVTKQLSYTRALGADAVILSPLMSKSTDCSCPGVVNFTNIDQRYGNTETLQAMMEKAKKLELKVVITIPLQTISTISDWFKSSAENAPGFKDWIVWRQGKPDETPMAEPGIESWTWHEGRSAFWARLKNESVLNLCSEGLASELVSAQCSWLRRGFSGVLLKPDYPIDQKCAVKLVKKMAAEAMSCVRSSNLETPVIMVESSEDPMTAAMYYSEGGAGAHSVLSIAMTSDVKKSAAELALAIHAALLSASDGTVPTWITSSSDESHLATRYGNELVDAMNMLSLVLPGAAIIQQGDELGTADTMLEWASLKDTCWPIKQAPYNVPFSWDSNEKAGFTTGEPWLPLAPNYRYANAKSEFSNEGSHAGVVRVTAAMRKSPAIGPHAEIKRLGDVLAVLRWGGAGSLLVVANLGTGHVAVTLSRIPGLASEMSVATSSAGSSVAHGTHVATEKALRLAPGEAVLLAGAPRHCGGPGPVDKITSKLAEGWQKINKYFSNA